MLQQSAADELRTLRPDQRNLVLDRMLQAFLADRFRLAVHRETKKVPVYELVIAENGPKLQESIPPDNYPHLRVIQASVPKLATKIKRLHLVVCASVIG